MKVLIGLGHPAHFHLFENCISALRLNNHIVKVVITDKDILEQLLIENNIDFIKLATRKPNEDLFDKAKKIFYSTKKLDVVVKDFKPQIMLGTLTQLAFVGKLQKIPFLFFGEDDITYTYLQCLITYPFVSNMLAPTVTKVGIFNYKKISYNGYQKLAYLHPNVFTPNPLLIQGIDINKPYSIIRLVDLSAYHDVNVSGMSFTILNQVIDRLKSIGKVYLSSEKQLPIEYENYKLPIEVKNIHHALAFATFFIGDSQSMSVEAAVLGIPALKFNDFAGRISVLEELENKYGLTYGYNTKQFDDLFSKIDELLSLENLKETFQIRRQKMLADKIDVTAFFVWFIENYPESARIMKENPDYQLRFR